MVVFNEYESFATEAMSMFKANPFKFRLVLKYRVDPSSSATTASSTTTTSSSSNAASASAAPVVAPGRLVVRATDSTRTFVFKTRELQDLKNCERLQLWLLNETATNESLFAKAISELSEERKKKKSNNSFSSHQGSGAGVGGGGVQKKLIQYPKMSGAQRRKARKAEKASLGPEGLAASRVKTDAERARDEKVAIKKARKLERRLQRQLIREQS
jgi:hypothetical protein